MPRGAYGGRETCESCRFIDVRLWQREGRFRIGHTFSCSWVIGDRSLGTMVVRAEENSLVLGCRFNNGSGTDQQFEQRIFLARTKCALGGARPWFYCLATARSCGRRAAVLYSGSVPYFACRRCKGLAYASQSEGELQRAINKARKIRMRVGGSPNLCEKFPAKPKGMHQRTYEQLRQANYAAGFD